jgi:light-regulated signal transduction histidine kinase (bacteriophytochrome)
MPIFETFDRLASNRTMAYGLSAATMAAFFVADLCIPSANLSIGYCLAPVLAVRTHQKWFGFATALTCTFLTWLALFAEVPDTGHVAVAAFDRAMVTGVIWFAMLLTSQRERAALAVSRKSEELEATTRELARSNGELESFAAVVAHDLRGPLSAINLMATMLKSTRKETPGAGDDDWIASILSQVTRMDELIRNLLDYGRAGGAPLRVAECDCQAIVAKTRENLAADLKACDGEVVAELLPTISADPTLITRLFQNLIENALKYRSQDAPRIVISAVKQDDGWTFCVADNGKGIEPAEAETIFQPFRQSEKNKGRYSGIGLGLATCKRIVERHGGRIWAESQSTGALFKFTLPTGKTSIATAPW